MAGNFVHLRLHTEYSLIDSVVRIEPLMDAVAAAGMPAVAVTDQCNLFAMMKFYRAALARGLQPIIGVDLLLREPGERQVPSRLTLLCQNLAGYRNLSRLVSRAYLEGQPSRGGPMIERDWLDASNTSGLIALSGAAEGQIGRALRHGHAVRAGRLLAQWTELFGDRYYLELQRLGRPEEHAYLSAALELAARSGAALVATNDVRFPTPEDFEAHEARVCIRDGTLLADAARPRRHSRQQYLRSAAQMCALFADVPEALENTLEIARRCSLALTLGQMHLPDYPVPGGGDPGAYLRRLAREGLEARRAASAGAQRYHERLAHELDVICGMGFAGYFLIVADFIGWARAHGVPVGPGRGSGAGSLVAYALQITDIDPLRYDLLFERFLNPERVSMPDFDVDFGMEGRDRVIDYVAGRYGHDRVAQIITYGTMAAKAVVRDVGRVLGHPYGFADRIAKLVPFELDITLEAALEKEPELKRLYREDEEVHDLLDRASALEGLTRNAGKHAGGVVIAPSVLTDFTPLYCEQPGANPVTQFDKDDIEAAGLVKFDFLGLRTLTVLERALASVNAVRAASGAEPLALDALPMDDAETYALLKSCRTTAVFQLESRGMRDLLRRLQPDCFEDLIAVVALFRPGPMHMIDDFIARKHAPAGTSIDTLHPDLTAVLAPTYGVILYQEQVMQIAQVLAGYTLGGADLLRRAMGKKRPEEMAKQRSVFLDGARARGVSATLAGHIFDLMEKFAGYGFNKSHSAGYALLAYQTAYLKTHYPAAFMAAVLSAEMDRTDKIVTLIEECASLGLSVQPPHVNTSDYAFAVADERTIRYGLGAIKGVGRSAAESLAAEREAHGRYGGLGELCRRIDLTRLNRRVLEALIRSGSLDGLAANRATLMAALEAAMQAGEQRARNELAGQVELFGGVGGEVARETVSLPPEPAWRDSLRLAGERETLGLYLSGHPIAPYEADLRHFGCARIGDVCGARTPAPAEGMAPDSRTVTVAGLVLEVRRRAGRMSFLLDDRTARLEITMFDEVYQRHRDLIVKDALLQVEGALRFDTFSDGWRLHARQMQPLAAVRERLARRLYLLWPPVAALDPLLSRLEGLLREARGGVCRIVLRYRLGAGGASQAAASGLLLFGEEWTVRPSEALLEQLGELLGPGAVRLGYAPAAPDSSAASA